MTERWWHRNWARNAAGYGLVVSLAMLILLLLMRLQEIDLTLPFGYDGDALFTLVQVRSELDHGSYLYNPDIGAPFGSELYDFPLPESLHFGVMKLFGQCGCNCVVAVNLYYLLTFPLTAVTAYFVLRHFGRGRWVALVAGLLYTFLPYHFMRGTHNLFLASYFLVPLMVMLLLWVYREPGLLFVRRESDGRIRLWPFSRRVLGAVAICALMASGGVYYAFFGCFFLVVIGIVRAAGRRFRSSFSAAVFIALIGAGVLINLAPNLRYTQENGANPTMQRHFEHAEMFALRVTQLLLPVPQHRLEFFRDLRARYDAEQIKFEINTAALGLVGSAGFLLLLARLFYRRSLGGEREQEEGLVLMNGAGLLLATMGSFGVLFALLVSPAIRGYTRMCVFLAFFALFALALVYERMYARWGRQRLGRWLLRGALPVVLVLGVLDQVSPEICFLRHQVARVKPLVDNDVAFVRAIEARLPAGAMVFQLPYAYYPEGKSKEGFVDYDHFRMYLQSQTLRWSHGAIKGRAAGLWQQNVSAMATDALVPTLVYAGFSGIYANRNGFDDNAQKLEADLRELLRDQPLQSADGKLLFFDLSESRRRLFASLTADQVEQRRDLAMHPVTMTWSKEFADDEHSPARHWRWCCAPHGEIYLKNEASRPRQVVVRFSLAGTRPSTVMGLESPLECRKVSMESASAAEQVLRFTLPPGTHCVRLTTDGVGHKGPSDPRTLYFCVIDCSVQDAGEQ